MYRNYLTSALLCTILFLSCDGDRIYSSSPNESFRLEEAEYLSFLYGKDQGFCFAQNHFWYTKQRLGLFAYNPKNSVEKNIYRRYYFGSPHITHDYDDTIWISGDEDSSSYLSYKQFSISKLSVTDSIPMNIFPFILPLPHYFHTAYDPIANQLVLFAPIRNYNIIFYKYYLDDKSIDTFELTLEGFNLSDYKSINATDLLITPEGRLNIILYATELDGDILYFLYTCNNLKDHNHIQTYQLPGAFKFPGGLSYYNGDLYIVYHNSQPDIGGKVFKLVF